MSYQPIGKQFTFDGEKYCLGVAQADDGLNMFAVFRQQGGSWFAMLPVIDDDLKTEDIMTAGTLAKYLEWALEKASNQIHATLVPVKPDATDKPACLAYDCALDVEFDPETLSFKFNKQPPLSHAR